MYTLAFYTFLPVGKMTHSTHNLRLSDCSFHHQAIHLTFRTYKFSRGLSLSIIIQAATHDLCPHKHLKAYLEVRTPQSMALFVDQRGKPIHSRQFSLDLNHLIQQASLTHLNIKPYSFRIGAATVAANMGIPADNIQRIGRWSSGAFTRYIRHQIIHLTLTPPPLSTHTTTSIPSALICKGPYVSGHN